MGTRKSLALMGLFTGLMVLGAIGPAQAIIIDPFLSTAVAENCGRFTIAPEGGENLHDPSVGNDYRIVIQVFDIYGDPVAFIGATECWLEHEEMADCPWHASQADHDTDQNGMTEFSGTIHAGMMGDASDGVDCDESYLYVYVTGVCIPVDGGRTIAGGQGDRSA